MHYWGDDWFKKNGQDFEEAIRYCMDTWRRWGRIGSYGKEKYGTFRDHVRFYDAWWPVHELVKPQYARYSWSKKLMYFEMFFSAPIVFLKIDVAIRFWQKMVYNYAIQKACKKYPHLVDELVSDLDHYDLIKPGVFGPICGKTIHEKYWTRH